MAPMTLRSVERGGAGVTIGAYAAVIAIRRHRELMQHKRGAPTANADVWSMHRLPDDEDYSA